MMESQTIIVIIGLAIAIILLVSQKVQPHYCFLISVGFIAIAGGTDIDILFQSFATPLVLTIGFLLVISAGLSASGIDDAIQKKLLPKKDVHRCIACLAIFVPVMSAFLNNTAVVAVLIPALSRWAYQNEAHVSKILMPLSFLSILGGTCTMIGSSTNIVAAQLSGIDMALFDITPAAIPALTVGICYILFLFDILLPSSPASDDLENGDDSFSLGVECEEQRLINDNKNEKKQMYHSSFKVPDGHWFVSKSLDDPDFFPSVSSSNNKIYVVGVKREGQWIKSTLKQLKIQAEDTILFCGDSDVLFELKVGFGLDHVIDVTHDTKENIILQNQSTYYDPTCLYEVVLSNNYLYGPKMTLSDIQDIITDELCASLLKVYRQGTNLPFSPNVPLQSNDLFIVQSDDHFMQRAMFNPNFSFIIPLASEKSSEDWEFESNTDSHKTRNWFQKKKKSILIFTCLAVFVGAIILHTFIGQFNRILLGVVIIYLQLRVLTPSKAGNVIIQNSRVLLTIMGALALSTAMEESGLTNHLADLITKLNSGLNTPGQISFFYILAMVISSFINNNAAVALLVPIVKSSSVFDSPDYQIVIFAIILGSSASFVFPSGYQTNLMVMAPGHYKSKHFLKFGSGLQVLVAATSIFTLVFFRYKVIMCSISICVLITAFTTIFLKSYLKSRKPPTVEAFEHSHAHNSNFSSTNTICSKGVVSSKFSNFSVTSCPPPPAQTGFLEIF
eukprot:Awhi_evm1s13768